MAHHWYLLKASGGHFLNHISLLNVLNKSSIKHNVNERFLITIQNKNHCQTIRLK